MARLNVELKEGIYKRFSEQVEEDGRSISDVIRTLILDFVEKRCREKERMKRYENGRNNDE